VVGCQTVCASSKVCPGLPVWHTGKRPWTHVHLDSLNMDSKHSWTAHIGFETLLIYNCTSGTVDRRSPIRRYHHHYYHRYHFLLLFLFFYCSANVITIGYTFIALYCNSSFFFSHILIFLTLSSLIFITLMRYFYT